jgi:hypothetical protein
MFANDYFDSEYFPQDFWNPGTHSSCQNRSSKFPEDWADQLAGKIFPGNGIWADFNKAFTYYEALKFMASIGILAKCDVPPEPVPADFSNDLDSAGTI